MLSSKRRKLINTHTLQVFLNTDQFNEASVLLDYSLTIRLPSRQWQGPMYRQLSQISPLPPHPEQARPCFFNRERISSQLLTALWRWALLSFNICAAIGMLSITDIFALIQPLVRVLLKSAIKFDRIVKNPAISLDAPKAAGLKIPPGSFNRMSGSRHLSDDSGIMKT